MARDWDNIVLESTGNGVFALHGTMSLVMLKLPITIKREKMNNMRAIHPGEIIKEEYLNPLGMSAHALATALRVPATRINDLVRQKRAVSVDTALRLARYFNTTAQFWLNLQNSYDLKMAQESLPKIEQDIAPLKVA